MSQTNQPEDPKEAWEKRIAQNRAADATGPRQPPQPQPVLQYGAPPMERSVNSVGKFFLQSLAGFGIGIAAVALGYFLAAEMNSVVMLFVPLGVAITVACVLVVKYQRFGYITGMLLAPLAIVAGLVILVLIICGKGFR